MAMKGYSAFPKAPALLERHHQIVYCHIQDTRWGGSYPSAEKQSVYSTAPADCEVFEFERFYRIGKKLRTRICQVIRLQNDTNFLKTLFIFQMILNFNHSKLCSMFKHLIFFNEWETKAKSFVNYNFELFLHMLFKFEKIWARNCQVIKSRNCIKFPEIFRNFKIISNFLNNLYLLTATRYRGSGPGKKSISNTDFQGKYDISLQACNLAL